MREEGAGDGGNVYDNNNAVGIVMEVEGGGGDTNGDTNGDNDGQIFFFSDKEITEIAQTLDLVSKKSVDKHIPMVRNSVGPSARRGVPAKRKETVARIIAETRSIKKYRKIKSKGLRWIEVQSR